MHKAHLIRIGNSQGVRLPKSALQESGLTGEVELEVKRGAIVIHSATKVRAGWLKAAQALAAVGLDDDLKDWLDLPHDDLVDTQ